MGVAATRHVAWGVLAALLLLFPSSCETRSIDATPDGGAATDGPAIDPRCAEIANTEANCTVGGLHAECSQGEQQPAAYCHREYDEGLSPCLWVSNGCPYGNYAVALKSIGRGCTCSHPTCPSGVIHSADRFFHSFGTDPWDNSREMNVAARFVGLEQKNPAFGCTKCQAAKCHEVVSLCHSDTSYLRVARHENATLQVWLVAHLSIITNGLYIEVDQAAGAARACAVHSADVFGCATGSIPYCAQSGSVTIGSEAPVADWDNTPVELDLTFPDGMRLTGNF
jgi:hypothetical protein